MPPITPPIRSTTGVVCDRPADLPALLGRQQPRNNPWVVIPIHDRNPTSRTPYVTRALIALNAVAFLVSPLVLGGLGDSAAEAACSVQEFFDRWAAIPRELMSGEQLPLVVGPAVIDATGAPACQLVEPAYEKLPIVSAVTAMFLHGGWAHLLGNMLFLFVFGNNVEDRLGRLRFLAFYDYGNVRFNDPVQPGVDASNSIYSIGLGMRMSYRKLVSLRLDAAQIMHPVPSSRSTDSLRVTGALAVVF